jgi:hypothetical protein
MWSAEKKTVAAVHQEIARELDTLLPRIFAGAVWIFLSSIPRPGQPLPFPY